MRINEAFKYPGLMPLALSVLIVFGLVLPDPANADSHDGKPKMVDLWSPGDSGQRMRIRGRVTSIDGRPLANVVIGIRHADSEGLDWSYHLGQVVTNEKGLYQFGSVIPGNSHRLSHVHISVDHDGYQYLDTEFYFKHDPRADENHPNAVFLEEGTVGGETMMYGRFDITLIPY